MKKLIIIVLILALIGGGVLGALWKLKLPPFKPAKKTDKAAAVKNKPLEPDGITDSAKPTSEIKNEPVAKPAAEPTKKPELKAAGAASDKLAAVAAAADFSEPNLTRLATIFDQMPVDALTQIFAKLTNPLAEALLRRMDEGKVSKLLPTFKPERAAALTLILAKSKKPNEGASASQ